MRSRTTLILVVVALVIGGLVALDHYKGTSTDQAATKRKRLLDFQAKEVTGLKIELTNQVVVLEKTGDQWEIKEPLNVRANASAVNSILDELELVERLRSISEKELHGADFAEFGLDHPRARATLQTRKGPVTLLVGGETPTKDALYAQVQGHKNVLVAPKSIYERLDRPLGDLRHRVVMDLQPAAATRLEIKSADRVIELARPAATTNVEPRWVLTRPLAARADPRKVSELLTDLSDLRVVDFESEDPKDLHTYGLHEPDREVTVWTGESGKTLLLGRTPPNDTSKVYAKLKSADTIFTVPAFITPRLAVQANDLRDAHVLTFAADEVHEIDLVRGGEKISIMRTDATWHITAPVAVAADDPTVQQLLRHLDGLNVKQFAADVATDLDKYGLAAPTAAVILHGSRTNDLGQLLVGAEDASNAVRFVKRADEPFVYGVDTNIAGWLPANYLALRTRQLAELNVDQISRLTVAKQTGKVIVERNTDGKWHLIEPAQGVLDNDALQRLLDALAQLRAGEFFRDDHENLVEYGLDQPEATITAAVDEKSYTLALGKLRGADRRYALWSDPALVFTIWELQANAFTTDIVTPAATAPASPAPSP
jgi:hypothetical protein